MEYGMYMAVRAKERTLEKVGVDLEYLSWLKDYKQYQYKVD